MKYFKTIIAGIASLFFFSCSNVHSKDANKELKELKSSEIIKSIDKGKDVVILNAIIYDDLDFSSIKKVAVSGPRQATADVNVHLYFQDCVFMGNVTTIGSITNDNNKVVAKKHTRFGGDVCFFNCDFRKEANFNESIFANNVVFTKTVFNGKASFNHILVNGTSCAMNEIQANDKFEFVIPTIRGDVSFMDAQFAKSANFSGCRVNDLILNNVQFEDRLDLSNAIIDGMFQFNYGKCEGDCQLSFSRFMDAVNILQTTFNGDFSMERSLFFGGVKLNRSSFAKKVNTEGSSFYMTPETEDVKTVEIMNFNNNNK